MRHHIRVTAAVAAGLLTLTLAACSGGGSDDADDSGSPAPTEDTAAPTTEAPTTAPSDTAGAADPADLASALLTVADIMVDGFVANGTDSADDAYVDDETGGICAMEFTDVMSPEMQATEVSAGFSNETLQSLLSESAWSGAGAEDVVTAIAGQFAACSGEYSGMWGDNAVTVTTSALDMEVPGAAASVCRYFEMTVGGTTDAYGPMCLAASGDRVVALMGVLMSEQSGLAPEDYQGVMAVAAAKAFMG